MTNGFLLDTHTLLWWLIEARSLSRRAFDVINEGDAEIFVSPVSAMEIGIKWRRGKLAEGEGLAGRLDEIAAQEGFTRLPISIVHADLAATAGLGHADPWDRLLYAQAKLEGLTLITCDRVIAASDLSTLW